ncbi:MAG: DUF5916 domain-containing protein [Gammaproteobacteria bacterium]|jgi:hypothetical protein
MRRIHRFPAVVISLIAAGAHGQTDLQDPGVKSVQMVRTATPPVIDGVLDDPVWANAAFIDNLHQVDPVEYAEPFERTEIFLLYDDDALYVGIKLYDDPDEITAQNLRQNDSVGQDDRIFVTIDPFNDQRSGYYFGLNPNGVRMDGIYQNVTEFYSAWDSIYYAEAGRFDEGWIAEFEIPFKSISFDPNTDTWGLNFSRSVVRKNEVIAWVTRNRQYNPAVSGIATGFEGLKQGIGLEVVPSVSGINSKEFHASAADSTNSDLEPSLDVAYRLTPSMNASLTVNTDFSATEVDDRQVNLDRFGLFFPEKRDFFLREADIFEFGNIGVNPNTVYAIGTGVQNGRPFFSRRIGLSPSGAPVDLDYGGKISGRVGKWEIGALSIRQDAYEYSQALTNPVTGQPANVTANVAADNLSVIRARAGVGAESTVGFILTEGDPRSNVENRLYGFDYLYRNSRLPGGRRLEAEAWLQKSETGSPDNSPILDDDNMAAGVGIRVPSASGVRGGAGFKRYERNFNPALGFLNRRGVDETTMDIGYTFRPDRGPVQQLLISLDAQRFERIDGELQSQSINFRPFQIANRTGDRLIMVNRVLKENLVVPFEISPGIVIPVGEYQFRSTGMLVQFSEHRKFAGRIRITDWSFYDGTRQEQLGEIIWRPSAKFRAKLSYDYTEIDLPQGAFETRLVSTGIDYVFSSTFSWVNLIQYDNVSETTGINMRLHWIPEAGRELFFVVNHNLQDFDRDNTFESQAADFTVKYTHTFRF